MKPKLVHANSESDKNLMESFNPCLFWHQIHSITFFSDLQLCENNNNNNKKRYF